MGRGEEGDWKIMAERLEGLELNGQFNIGRKVKQKE